MLDTMIPLRLLSERELLDREEADVSDIVVKEELFFRRTC